MELRDYFSIAWKWLWLILLSAGIAAGASYYVTQQQPRIYQASAKMLVGQSLQNANPNYSDLFTSQQLALTYIQIAKTSQVLQNTIDALGVPMAADQFAGQVNVSIVQGTQLIDVRVVDTSPQQAQALANELAHQLTLQGPAATDVDQARQRDFIQKQVNDVQGKIQDGQKTITDLQNSIQVTASAREIADKQQQIQGLQTQIAQWQQTYATLLAFLAPRSPNYLTVIEPASLPVTPIAPNVPLNAAVAGAIGLLLSVGAAFLLEYLDDTVKNPDDVTRLINLPTLGAIANIGGPENEKLITTVMPRSPISEAFRVMRTNIQFSDIDTPPRSILLTSAEPHEGKSLTAANLAVVMAQAGLRTILVDGDLRKPVLHRIFGLSNDVGLTTALMHNTLDGCLRPTRVENLRLLTTGGLPPNPAEVLASEKMKALAKQLEGDSDVLLFDSPPSLVLADAAIMARFVDGVVLVLDSAHTRRESAIRAKQALEKMGRKMLGVVLNRIRLQKSGYYNYYYYYYYYAPEGGQARKRKPSPAQAETASVGNRIRTFVRRP